MALYLVLFIVSLAVLVIASDWFIGAAEKIGLGFGVSPFVIGVTIIAFGTSLPELATSIAGIYNGESEVVIGNVIGSNITNILLVLGLTAVVGKGIDLEFNVMQNDMPMLFASAFLLYFMIQDLTVTNTEAILLLLMLMIFLINSVKSGVDENLEKVKVSLKTWGMLFLGGVLVYIGAKYTLINMKEIATGMGVSTYVLSVTGVALGTSLPEVVVSIAAARRGQHAIAVGNVLGSNIFNTYAVIGIPTLLKSIEIPAETLGFGAPMMVAITILFGMVCISKKITRWEGMTLLVFYVFFIGQYISQALPGQ